MDKLFYTKRKYTGYDGDEYINMCIPVVKIDELFGNAIEEANQDCNGRLDTFVWNNVKES